MPTQKRPLPSDASPPAQLQQDGNPSTQPPPPEVREESDGDGNGDGDGDGESSAEEACQDEFILVNLSDIRKEVQCPICLGIIRKTRTVMECLHRFCRECIDKSMRLGNNECPACRTHCASRRSLRDDPNFDALIAALYPDIDKYEEEELALQEEEKTRNEKIQASIAETYKRQSEALGKRRSTAKATAAAFVRRSKYRSVRRRNTHWRGGRTGGHNTSPAVSDDEEDVVNVDVNDNDGAEDSLSAEESSQERRPKRRRRRKASWSSPARTSASADVGCEENDNPEASRENLGTLSLTERNREIPAWGKGGARSQTRHGNASGSNSRFVKGGRTAKMLQFLHNLDEKDDEFDVHLTLLPLDGSPAPQLKRPYLCCRPSLSIRQLCQYIAIQISAQAEVEIAAKKLQDDPSDEFQALGAQRSLAELPPSSASTSGDLVLVYRLKA